MALVEDFICPLAIPHEITVDKTLWEEEYETTYVSGGDITVEDLISGKETAGSNPLCAEEFSL